MFEEIKNNVLDGNQDPLIAYAELKEIQKELNETISEVELVAQEEAAKYEKTFQLHGYTFERRNGATRYSYKHIPKWNELNQQVKDYESVCKAALKAGEKMMQVADEEGEEIPLPTVTVSKDSLIVKKI